MDYVNLSVNGQIQAHPQINTHQLLSNPKLISNDDAYEMIKSQQKKVILKCTILQQIQSVILAIREERNGGITSDSILNKYREVREILYKDFQDIKQSANELYNRLGYCLFKDILLSSDEWSYTMEHCEDLVKIRISDIAIKLKELDRCIFQDGISLSISKSKIDTYGIPRSGDDELQSDIDKFLMFITSSKMIWKCKPLPQNIDEAFHAIKDHQDILSHSKDTWENIRTLSEYTIFQSYSEKENKEKLLYKVAAEKKRWENEWRFYLNDVLQPRYDLYKKLKTIDNDVDEDIRSLNGLLDLPNNTLPLVHNLKNELAKLKSKIPKKKQVLENLCLEATNIHQSDFKKLFSSINVKLEDYKEGLRYFFEVEGLMEEILEFLPKLLQFNKDLENKAKMYNDDSVVMSRLTEDVEGMKSQIERFDIQKLRKVANIAYGNSERVDCIIDELKRERNILTMFQINEELIIPKHKLKKEISVFNLKDYPSTIPYQSSECAQFYSRKKLYLEITSLPKDQYNIQWYKEDVSINPSKDSRIWRVSGSSKGELTMNMGRLVLTGDVEYYCELQDMPVSKVLNSSPYDNDSEMRSPTFDEPLMKEVYAYAHEAVVMQCKVTGNPLPTLQWIKDGRKAVPSDDIEIRDTQDLHTLTVVNPQALHSGIYEAVASNSQGSESRQCLLKFIESQEISVSEDTCSMFEDVSGQTPDQLDETDVITPVPDLMLSNTDVREPPQVVKMFSDMTLKEGENLVLKYRLVGQPAPKVCWSHNGRILRNPRGETSHNLDEYYLKIRDVKEEDSGNYLITAENSSGLATCSVLVTVDKDLNTWEGSDDSSNMSQRKVIAFNSENISPPEPSRMIQITPAVYHTPMVKTSYKNVHNDNTTVKPDDQSAQDIDYTKRIVTTVKTYHYSGPSGIDLPGIGFITKSTFRPPTSSPSTDNEIRRAVFVSRSSYPETQINSTNSISNITDPVRFSYAESSECEYP